MTRRAIERQVRGVGIGTTSLIMIFSVLCLTFFAVLTLSSANAEDIMSKKNSTFVESYYAADSRATRICAEVISSARRGVIPGSVDGIAVSSGISGGQTTVSYRCPINGVQDLAICLKIDDAGYDILFWETRPAGAWEPDQSLIIWDGDLHQ